METLIYEDKVLKKASYRNDMLKLLAMVTMLIDHIGYMYFPNETLFRIIGRLAFPIFAYQIAIGYSKTSNLKKYVFRLSVFAIITQIPYSYFNPNLQFNPLHFNVIFTFILSIGLLYVYDLGILKIKEFSTRRNYLKLLYGILLLMLSVIIIILPEAISFLVKDFYLEYGLLCLVLVFLFHVFKDKKQLAIFSVIILYFLHGYYRVALFNSEYSLTKFYNNLLDYNFYLSQFGLENRIASFKRYYFNAWGVLTLIPIYFFENIYTGRIRLNKYIAYIFYPVHMAILVVIAIVIKSN